MVFKDLEKKLGYKAGLKPVYIVLGDEGLVVSAAEKALADEALSGGGASFNRDVFRCSEDNAAESLSVARTLPMMAARRVVLLREAQEAPAALLQQLADYLASPNPSTVMVITGAKWPAPSGGKDWGRRAEGAAKKVGVVVRMKSKDQDPVAFSMAIAEELGCTLKRQDAEFLVERVGGDLGRLKLELEKAALWLGDGGALTAAVLQDVCSLLAEAEIWTLTDALVSGNADRALETAHRLMEDGEAPHRLISMVTWQFRQLLRLQDAIRSGRSAKEAGIRMRYDKLRAAERALRERPMDAPAVLETIAAANQAMNSHKAGHRRIFEGLVLELLAR